MKSAVLLFCLVLIGSRAFAPTNVRGWYADGQVWIVWQSTLPEAATYAIYSSMTPFTNTNQATLIGRLFKGEWTPAALREQTKDSTLT